MNAPLNTIEDAAVRQAIADAVRQVKTFRRPGPAGMSAFYGAFAKAQGAFAPIEKNKTVKVRSDKGNYEFKYADLASIRESTTPALSENGLCLYQIVNEDSDGIALHTVLAHESESELESIVRLTRTGDMKQFGAAITYLRRYVVGPMLGVVADDDIDEDGQPGSEPGATIAPLVHDGMKKAKSIGELAKIMSGMRQEDKAKYSSYFNQRQDELEAAARASAGGGDL